MDLYEASRMDARDIIEMANRIAELEAENAAQKEAQS